LTAPTIRAGARRGRRTRTRTRAPNRLLFDYEHEFEFEFEHEENSRMTATLSEAPVWDLSDLYSGLDDPAIQRDCDRLRERACSFEERYRGRIAASECTTALLRAALDEYEEILRDRAKPVAYSSLMFNADTRDPARGALLQKMRAERTAITVHLIFFELELGRMPEGTFRRLIEDPALASYRHYLEHERTTARHHLTEPEEKILEELDDTGILAFQRLFSEVTGRAVYRLRVGETVQELNQSQVLALLYHPDREMRKAASAAVTETLKEQSHVLSFIFNNLLQEKGTRDRLRRYEYPEQARHQSDELPSEVVETMVDACVRNYGIVAEYYDLKRRLLGLDELLHYDRYAPIGAPEPSIPFSEAQETVLVAFDRFAPTMRDIAERFFARQWIDAEVRAGKRGGAFCGSMTPDLHPYVFLNYTEQARDVMTLAHELGHALHAVLARENNYLDFHATLPMAETASVFAEMLVFEELQGRIQDPQERLALLCEKLEGIFATVFRQVSMYRFEQQAHRTRRDQGEQTTEKYGALWQSAMQEMFGDSLVLEDEHACWWLYIPHIYNTPFYVYAYAFGELLVMALYARYKEVGPSFVQSYLDLLAQGGSRKPEEMLSAMGIDIRDRGFWEGGIRLIGSMVEQAKALASGIQV
jgi:oligoendopeptidase F